MKALTSHSSTAYALLRIFSGFMFTFHGVQKIFGYLAEFQPAFMTQIWIGGVIELICGIAIMIGVRTRLAAFLCSGMMAVAYFQFHWKFQFDTNFFPAINKGELAVLYCFVFLFIATQGGVKWAIDKES